MRTQRQRLLTTARLAGAAALGIVAQVAVDMPDGYFGAADRVTAVGAAYSVGLLVLVLVTVIAQRRSRRLAGWLVPAVYSLNAAVFVPAVVSDPVVAGGVAVWNLVLVTQFFFPAPSGAWAPREVAEGFEARLAKEGPALRHLALVSLALTVAVVGYRLSDRFFAEAVCLALGYGTLVVSAPLLRLLWRERSPAPPAIALPAAAGIVAALLAGSAAALSLLALAQAVLLATLFARGRAAAELLSGFYHNPPRLIVVSFAALVLVGTVLLTFPAASAGPRPIAPLDALFTATSAACVTGLIVLDTPAAFSPFGHGVLLALIQVGGLGIMVLSTFAALLLGGTLGLRGERALIEVLDLQAASSAYRLTRFIVLATLSIEAAGALGLAIAYRAAGFDWVGALWRGTFHAVSAFCNAGFALQTDSIEMFQRNPAALLLFAALITLGGLGFAVLAALWLRRRRVDPAPASVQVKTVLAVSAILVAAGTAIYAAAEWGRSLDGLPVADRLVNALFQSVTLRTAGFNSVSFAALAPATALAMIGFMFVGASPGSAGGGIKTTTVAVLAAAIRSTVGRNRSVRLFDREVPGEIVYRSLAIAVTSAAVVGCALFLLLLFEPQPFQDLLFEVVSAFGTVGLSLGATPKLGPAGKLIIIAVMFVGRTGPLTLALLLGTGAARAPAVRRPESRVMVG